jgi:hypothetical protein
MNAFSQWTCKSVDNGFDEPYDIVYSNIINGASIKLLKGETPCDIRFTIHGKYFCDDNINVNLTFIVNGEYEKYYLKTSKSRNSEWLYFSDLSDKFWGDFKKATVVKIRVNETYCSSEYYEYKMTGSTAAYNFITRGCEKFIKNVEKERFQDSINDVKDLIRLDVDYRFLTDSMGFEESNIYLTISDYKKLIRNNSKDKNYIPPKTKFYIIKNDNSEVDYYRCIYNLEQGEISTTVLEIFDKE